MLHTTVKLTSTSWLLFIICCYFNSYCLVLLQWVGLYNRKMLICCVTNLFWKPLLNSKNLSLCPIYERHDQPSESAIWVLIDRFCITHTQGNSKLLSINRDAAQYKPKMLLVLLGVVLKWIQMSWFVIVYSN